MANKDNYGFDYKGTLPLTFDLFPEITGIIEEGRPSNIYTGLHTNKGADSNGNFPSGTKFTIIPGMMNGQLLNDEHQQILLEKGLNFGIYNSLEAANEADSLIHKSFQDRKPLINKIMDWLKGL
jgi:hypothetical protein